MTLAPRVEVFTRIACDSLQPVHTYTSAIQVAALGNQTVYFAMHGEIESPHLVLGLPSRFAKSVHSSAATLIRHDNGVPRPMSAAKCRADPAVQQGAAKLQTRKCCLLSPICADTSFRSSDPDLSVMITLTGALSSLTAGFWGAFGDRHGRSSVIALGIMAMLVT